MEDLGTEESKGYRLTIDDFDPGWAEDHVDRLADVHGMAAGTGHWWADRNGRYVQGYETGGSCGGCGWRPIDADVITSRGSIIGREAGPEGPT